MKTIFLLIFLFAQSAWCKTQVSAQLNVSSTSPEQFSVKEVSGDPTRLIFVKANSPNEDVVDFKYTVSDYQKLNITLNRGGKNVSIEMLLVVLVSGARHQLVQIYAPTHNGDFIVGNNINPRCSLLNHGDFSWGDPRDLNSKLSLDEASGQVSLNIMVKAKENGPKAFTECLRFRTNSGAK